MASRLLSSPRERCAMASRCSKLLTIVWLLVKVSTEVAAFNILGLFPHPGYSQFKSFSPIVYRLAERGHNVTVVTHFPTKNPHPNYHEIFLKSNPPFNAYSIDVIAPSTAFRKALREFYFLQGLGKVACQEFFESGVVDKILERHGRDQFDLLLVEVFNTDCLLGLAQLLQKPVAAFSSCVLMPWYYDRVGLPDFPSYISQQFSGFSEDMTYWERLLSYIITKGLKLLYRTTELSDNHMIKKYLNTTVDVHDLAKDIKLILVNQHYSISGARPLSTRVVEVGGSYIEEKLNPLPKNLRQVLDNSKDGVILISWGSLVNASTISDDKKLAMVEAMKKLNQHIVWKWDSDQKPTNSEKFLITKWIQQKEVLCK